MKQKVIKNMTTLRELFRTNRVVGLAGNRSSGKSSLALTELIELHEDMIKRNVKLPIYVFGVEEKLKPYLKTKGIQFLYSKDDILDLKVKNCIIFVDEVSLFFSTTARDKETEKFKRFINRIAHNNCWFILGTAEVGWFNKLACSMINAFIVKTSDFDMFVNGTWLKRLVMGLENTSDYRLDIPINTFYVIESSSITTKHTYKYNKELDSKADNVNPFK